VSSIILFFPNYASNTPLTSPHSATENNSLESPTYDNYDSYSPISPVLEKFKDCNVDEKELKRKNVNNNNPVFSNLKYKEIEALNGLLETLYTFVKSTYFDYFMDQYGDESLYNDDYSNSESIKISLENLESSLLDLLVLPLVKGNNGLPTNKRGSETSNSTKEFSHYNDTNLSSEENENDIENFVENMKFTSLGSSRSSRENFDIDIDEYDENANNAVENEEQQRVNENEKLKTKDEMKNELSCNSMNILSVIFQYEFFREFLLKEKMISLLYSLLNENKTVATKAIQALSLCVDKCNDKRVFINELFSYQTILTYILENN